MNTLYLAVLITTIVVGIQAVGVILIAALLIISSVSARYWTESFKIMVILSALIGGASGVAGTLISAVGKGWPTGPIFVVIVAACIFVISLVFGKEKGLIWQYMQEKAPGI